MPSNFLTKILNIMNTNKFEHLKDNHVIHGTSRMAHIIPTLLELIEDTPEYVQITQFNCWEYTVIFDPTADELDERWESRAMHSLCNELIDVIDSYSPEGYYFGVNAGNSSEYGFWKEDYRH